MENEDKISLSIIEIQIGSYLGEEDKKGTMKSALNRYNQYFVYYDFDKKFHLKFFFFELL